MKRTLPVLILLLLATGACAAPAEEQDAAAVLQPQAGEIRAAAARRDRAGAGRELEELRSTVEDLRRSNDLSNAEADEILRAADEVERYLGLITAPTPSPLRRSPTPSPTPRPTTPSPTPEPTITQPPEPPPTREPEPPPQTQEPPDDQDRGNGNDGGPGLPSILPGPD